MDKKQRALRGSATASARGEEAAPAIEEVAAAAEAEIKANDLDAPKTQWSIENPEEMRYTLDLTDHGKHEIIVKSAFSYADVHDRGVLEDLESFYLLVSGELGKYGRETGDPNWMERDPGKIDVVLAKSTVRRDARAIIAKISRYADPWKTLNADGREALHARPTVDELADGMDSPSMMAVALFLIGCYHTEVENRKKARAAAAK